MKTTTCLLLILVLVATAGCKRDAMSEVGFSLPPGDSAAGRDVFQYMHCGQCHTIAGETLAIDPNFDEPYVELGGRVTRVKTYGQLITAIINPSHKLADGYPTELVSEEGESNMYIYNRHMTVQELIDLVMFLQPYYDVIAPDYRYVPYL